MKKGILRHIVAQCLCFTAFTLFAQHDPFYIQINQKEKLPGTSVYDVLQDSKGFIWVATEKGLSRYDGFDFKTYTHPAQTSLPGTNISEDSKGRIWYQNFDGFLYYVENDSLKPILNINPSTFHPYAINENKLFFLDHDAIHVLNIETLQKEKGIDINIPDFKLLVNAINGVALISIDHSVLIDNEFKNKQLKINFLSRLYSFGNSNIKNEIWIYSKNKYPQSFYRFDKYFNPIDSFQLSLPYLIQDLVEIEGRIYICHNKGIDLFTNNLKTENFIRGFNVSTLIEDQNQNLWVSTIGEGILHIPNSESTNYPLDKIKPSKLVKSKNGFYLSTKNGEVFELDSDLKITKKILEDPKNAEIYYLALDSVSDLLFATGSNFIIYDTKSSKIIYTYKDAIKEITYTGNNQYAYASSNMVSYLYLSNKNRSDPRQTQEKSNPIKVSRAKGVDFNFTTNELLYSTNKGLYYDLDGTSHEIKIGDSSFFANKAYWIGNEIIAKSTMGDLYLIFNKKNFVKLNSIIGVANQSISDIKIFGDRIGIIANGEILIYDFVAKKLLHSGYFKDYYEMNDFISFDSTLMIITSKSIIKQKHEIMKRKQPLFYINNVIVNGKSAGIDKLKDLNNKENNISILYSVLNFGFEKPFQLKYKINRGPWAITNPDSRTLDFKTLAPGNYKIQFMLNSTLLASALEFKISPPYWDTWWFYCLVFITITAAIYLYLNRQYSLMKKQVLLTQQKTSLERELNKSVMTSIRSQMNPHFFYNALNTIQAFIFTNDKTRANNYLAKFSKLTRLILENSEKETISLNDEINALQLYLELEKMRFKDTFEFSIQTNENLDSDSIEIPPMLIQPYVENAIKHGLLHLETIRILKISFAVIDKLLTVTIDDNGVGRKRSGEINSMKHEKPESFSTKANQSRLEILNKGRTNKIGVEYIDRITTNGVSAGTTVTLTIPI